MLGQPQPQFQPQGGGQVGRQAPGLGNGAVGCGEVARVQRQFGVGHVPGQLGRGTEVGQPRQVGVALFGVLHGVAGACGDQQGQRAVVFQRLVVQRLDRFALGFLVTALEKGQRALAQGRAGRAELAFALVVAHAVRQGQRHTKGPQDQVKRQQGGDGQHHHQVERQLHPVGREHQDGVALADAGKQRHADRDGKQGGQPQYQLHDWPPVAGNTGGAWFRAWAALRVAVSSGGSSVTGLLARSSTCLSQAAVAGVWVSK